MVVAFGLALQGSGLVVSRLGACLRVAKSRAHTHTHRLIHSLTHLLTHTHTHTDADAHVCAHAHAHARAHAHAHALSWKLRKNLCTSEHLNPYLLNDHIMGYVCSKLMRVPLGSLATNYKEPVDKQYIAGFPYTSNPKTLNLLLQ